MKARTFAAWGLLTALGSASAAKRTPELVQSEQHRPIWLRNEAGEIINPLTGQNAGDPYSPLQTCGASKCHDSAFITRGYHFQQGAERLSDGYDPARPWDLSNGMFGKYRPASVRQLARKKNESATKIDMTVWEWVTSPGLRGEPPCAACHPGGGPLERDREGKRYDAVLRRDPGLARSLDGDYRGSHWDKSGVLEADCLMCHSGAYDWNERVAQLRGWNLKWAATAASGLGLVQGRLFDAATGKLNGDTPRVTYNKRLFNEDGKILAPIIKRPGDRNCLYCHADASLKKRGFTWNDPLNPDVHNQQGMGCVSCHVSGLDHNFAKGTTHVETVRDDLDGTMRECKECHTTGYHGASVPSHVAVPPSHLVKIGCKTCHIPSLKRAAGKSFDVTRGDLHWDVVGAASRVGAAEKWYPAYENVKGQLQPVNPIATLWWGNREADGKVHPLFAREIEAAWALYGGEVRDDNGDGLPEVNRPQEIEAGLRAFARVLAAGGRFSRIQPVYVKGDRLWEIGPDGKLTAHADPACERTAFSISHNVAPAKEALGSKGCTDCHSREGRFFARTYVVDPVNEEGKEARAPVYRTLGLSDTSYTIFSVYWSLARPWIGLVLLLLFFILSLHFTRFGPHDFGGRPVEPRPDDYERIARFSWFERMLHLVVLIVFLFLGFTGLAFSFEGWRWMQLVFGDQLTPRVWHGWLGYVFGGGVILMFVRWCRDAVLVRSDIEWLKKLGGYLGGHEPIEAGRFNAGQKIYFWTVVLGGSVLTATGIVLFFQDRLSLDLVFIAAILHNLAGLFGVAGVLSHIYLSTAANPGTVQAIFAGWVTRAWARLHHPLWYEQVTGRPAAEEAEREEEAPQKKEEPPAGG